MKEVETQAQVNEESKELVIQEDGQQVVIAGSVTDLIMSGAKGNFMCSIVNDGTSSARARIFNAISDNDGKIRDMIGKTLDVQHLMAYPVRVANIQTGEVEDAIRVVLITTEGKSYGSVAKGVFDSLKNIIAICGTPPWDSVKLVPVEKETRAGYRTLVFRMEA